MESSKLDTIKDGRLGLFTLNKSLFSLFQVEIAVL